jgi:hypothetical protein
MRVTEEHNEAGGLVQARDPPFLAGDPPAPIGSDRGSALRLLYPRATVGLGRRNSDQVAGGQSTLPSGGSRDPGVPQHHRAVTRTNRVTKVDVLKTGNEMGDGQPQRWNRHTGAVSGGRQPMPDRQERFRAPGRPGEIRYITKVAEFLGEPAQALPAGIVEFRKAGAHRRKPVQGGVHRTIRRWTRAGQPYATTPAGTSRVTTEPAPTSASSPIVTPARITEPDPTLHP